jgi:hypothetical protein
MDQCQLCDQRVAETGYCKLHEKAYRNLIKKYKAWKKALDLSWEKYLTEVLNNPLTGTKAKEVAEALLRTAEDRHPTNH